MDSETNSCQCKKHDTYLASLLIHFHPQTAEEREVKRDGFYRQETTYNKREFDSELIYTLHHEE